MVQCGASVSDFTISLNPEKFQSPPLHKITSAVLVYSIGGGSSSLSRYQFFKLHSTTPCPL
jgi:hypothetical protein